MASKFVELKEAAQMLGLSPDELNTLREDGEIHGYRDGASWKFKMDEVERVAGDKGITLSAAGDEFSLSDDDLDGLLSLDDSGDDMDASSILVSDDSGKSESGSSSTVIGKDELEIDGDLKLSEETSDISAASDISDSGSNVTLEADDGELTLEADDSVASPDSDMKLADSGEFELSDSSLALDSDSMELSSESDLALEEEEELVLESSSGDLNLGSGDSGILGSPSDSGLSLEDDSLELSGSSGALELPEDEDMISLEGEIAGPDDATQLKQDEEFLLSPSDEMVGDESSDSGSQVIALEDSEAAFDDDGVVTGGEPALLADDVGGLEAQFESLEATPMAASAGGAMAFEIPEAPYSVWNVLGLFLILVFLTLTGMLMSDVVMNMWTWNSGGSRSSALMEAIINALGL